MTAPARKPAAAPKRPAGAEGVEPGDHVYARHPERGPIAVHVRATGTHGFTGDDQDGGRHRMPWSHYLGHRARMLQRYAMVEQGADGALLEDERGKRRFLAGQVPVQPDEASQLARSPPPATDDPLLGGMGRLKKALPPMPDGARVLFLKAGPIANAPGLTLRDVTDREGHITKRWMRSMPDAPGPGRKPAKPEEKQAAAPPAMQHGDTVGFRHGEVQGQGKIVASGADGVTVATPDGREHQVRHEHLTGPSHERPAYPEKKGGEDDKAYLKRTTKDLPEPDHLPEDHGRYFHMDQGHEVVPIDKLVSSKTDEENAKGGANAPKIMQAAYHGQVGKRAPIAAEKQADGTYKVTDGNGTLTGAKKHGWKSLPVKVTEPAGQGDAAGAAPKPLFAPEEMAALPAKAAQPVKTQQELYAASAPALDHLKEWLDRDKGLCSQLGYETMTTSPEAVDWSKPGGMLFIAPLKGEKRAAQKVESDYGGDWSQLRDVVRCSIAVDTMEEVQSTLAKLKENGLKLAMQPKDRFAKPVPVGYRDLLMNVEFPNGTIGEVQLHWKPMLAAKSEGHHAYEVMRDIEVKPREQWGDEDKAAWQKAFDESVAIYSKAWGAASGGAEMRKAMGMADDGAWEYFDHDGATFRRPAGAPGGVTDVLHGENWKPYKGDRTAAYLYGNRLDGPPGGMKPRGRGMMRKSMGLVLFLKAAIPGGAAADLFAAPSQVAGHTTSHGTYVAPYQATRRHKWDRHAEFREGNAAAAAGQPRQAPYYRSSRAEELWNAGHDHHGGPAPSAAAPRPFTLDGGPSPDAAPRGADAGAPKHIQEMQGRLASIEASRFKTASDEKAAKVYLQRLGADPAKWRPGQGVRHAVMAHGGQDQWNRGFRIVAVHPEDLMATIRQAADTGLTETGGNSDRIGDQKVYLGDLKRDRQYDGV